MQSVQFINTQSVLLLAELKDQTQVKNIFILNR